MANTLQTLLDINAIMKQRVEQRFAELVKEREAIKSEIATIKQSINSKKDTLQSQQEDDPFAINLFLEWAAALHRKIKALEADDETLMKQQKPIRAELASIFVREKTLTSRRNHEKKDSRIKVQKNQDESRQSLWLQKNF